MNLKRLIILTLPIMAFLAFVSYRASGTDPLSLADAKTERTDYGSPVASVESVDIAASPESEGKTDIIPSAQLREDVRILFVGDMMLDRHIRQKTHAQSYLPTVSHVAEFLGSFDAVVGNLEGPVTSNPSKSLGSAIGESRNYVFTFDPSVLETLRDANIRFLNIGNNHILNFGREGLVETQKNLEDARIPYLGDIVGVDKPFLLETVSGLRVAIVGFNQFGGNGADQALGNVRRLRQEADILVVYTHWGVEYQFEQPGNIRDLARSFVDAGADAVIGTHPHVISRVEEYKGKKIYYSLGNFIFDQYFSKEVKKGLGVEMAIDPVSMDLSTTDHFFEMRPDGSTRLLKE